MHRLNELAARLTPAQLKEVEDFAEFLSTRTELSHLSSDETGEGKINVDALLGLCKGMGGDRSDKELIREAWDGVVAKALK